jgi:hypothetical protein
MQVIISPQRHRVHREIFFICRQIPANENRRYLRLEFIRNMGSQMTSDDQVKGLVGVTTRNSVPEALSSFARWSSPHRAKKKPHSVISVSLW